jgi:hypothetical protein
MLEFLSPLVIGINSAVGALLPLLLGMFVAANIPAVQRFFSVAEFFKGVERGLRIGENWRKKDK